VTVSPSPSSSVTAQPSNCWPSPFPMMMLTSSTLSNCVSAVRTSMFSAVASPACSLSFCWFRLLDGSRLSAVDRDGHRGASLVDVDLVDVLMLNDLSSRLARACPRVLRRTLPVTDHPGRHRRPDRGLRRPRGDVYRPSLQFTVAARGGRSTPAATIDRATIQAIRSVVVRERLVVLLGREAWIYFVSVFRFS